MRTGVLGAAIVACAVLAPVGARNAPPAKGKDAAKSESAGSYMQEHMANEHHIGNFDLASFFALHDFDRNGLLDRAEIEAIYGVHHSLSRKHSPNAEVHDEKADKIVREVLRRLDKNHDSLITRQEFLAGGPNGLPTFPEYGKHTLGHHYDEESEFFVHHESIYHRKEEDQGADSYTHPEDLKHFAHHKQIELEEEDRERVAEGMPTIEEEAHLQDAAQKQGKNYESKYEKQFSPEQIERDEKEHARDMLGEAGRELISKQHIFRTPNGPRKVEATADNVILSEGEFGEGDEPPVFAAGEDGAARAPIDHVDGETELARKIRLDRARREASGRPRFGAGKSGFAKPKDDADRLKQGMPYKYRVKKSGFLREL
ncbi:hypothetical protein MBRA1_000711 [Malassezia brasiliensis]|uniref:EF-hand domain-containing protein n=1 Tax=Malassezia brasiliensis TaxID=1821822 RepID=A0AAF0INT7_9BASI|nr:hypothetical protein MBRA1_000711 [Malassezia brasiliensis]